jgi:hypothetical protein
VPFCFICTFGPGFASFPFGLMSWHQAGDDQSENQDNCHLRVLGVPVCLRWQAGNCFCFLGTCGCCCAESENRNRYKITLIHKILRTALTLCLCSTPDYVDIKNECVPILYTSYDHRWQNEFKDMRLVCEPIEYDVMDPIRCLLGVEI